MTAHFLTFLAAVALQSGELPRDPFWPQDYEGTRHPITLEPRVKPKASHPDAAREGQTNAAVRAETAADAKARELARIAAEDRLWAEARKTLKFGGTMGFNSADGNSTAITINDRIYTVGDVISSNCGNIRYTWKIEAVAPAGKIRLRRIKHICLNGEPTK